MLGIIFNKTLGHWNVPKLFFFVLQNLCLAYLSEIEIEHNWSSKFKILATPMEGGGAALLSEKVHLLSFEETVVGVVALRLEVGIQGESGCYLLQPFEHQSVVGNFVLPFEPVIQKVGYVLLALEREVFGIVDVLLFEKETQKAGCVFHPFEYESVVGNFVLPFEPEIQKVGYVLLALEKEVFGIVDVLPFEKETQKVGCVVHPFEYQSVVGNFGLPFEPETQKVGYAFLQLEKAVFGIGIAEVLPFEMETQKVCCAHQPFEQKAVMGAVVDAHKLGYVFYPIEKGILLVVDGMQVLDGNCIQFGSYLAASQSHHLSQHF